MKEESDTDQVADAILYGIVLDASTDSDFTPEVIEVVPNDYYDNNSADFVLE